MNITLRPAKHTDIEAITQIGIAAFPFEPQWNYRYPHRTFFPEDHYTYTRMRYLEWLSAATTPQCSIMVAELATEEDPKAMEVGAFAIWRLPLDAKDDDDNLKRS